MSSGPPPGISGTGLGGRNSTQSSTPHRGSSTAPTSPLLSRPPDPFTLPEQQTPTSSTILNSNNSSVAGSQVIGDLPVTTQGAVVGGPTGQIPPAELPGQATTIKKRLENTASSRTTAAAHEAQMHTSVARLDPSSIPDRVKRRMEQLESMRAKVKAQMDKLSAGTGESQKSILEDLRKEGFTVSLEKEDAAAAKELEMLKAGKYLDIFGDLYYTTLITPLEDSIGLSKAQSWNHLGLQSLNQFIINYNINTALGDDLGRTLEIFLQVFGADKGGAEVAAAAPVAAVAAPAAEEESDNENGEENGEGNAEGNTLSVTSSSTAASAAAPTAAPPAVPATTPAATPSGPDGKLACTMDELRYLIPPLRHRMLTLRSQARLFTLNAGANSRGLTPNAHHYLDVAERIGTFLASAVKKCGNAWNNMGAVKAAAPEPAPQSIINEELMKKINEIHEYIKRMEAAEKKPVEPSSADLAREYLMQRFLDYQMLREDARAWLNKKLLKAAVQARFDALEAQVAAVNPAVAEILEDMVDTLNVLMETTPTIDGLDRAIDGIHIKIERATNNLGANIRDTIRNGVNAIIGNVQDALEAHVERTEELAGATQNLIRLQGRDITTSINAINAQLAELMRQRAANEAKIRRLTEELARAYAEMNEIIAENRELDRENQRLRRMLNEIDAALRRDIADRDTQIADRDALIAELENVRRQNETRIRELVERIDALTAEKDAAAAAAQAAAESARAATTRAETAEAERAAATTRAETAEAERAAATTRAVTAEAAAETARGQAAAAQAALAIAQAHVDELNTEIARLQAQLTEQMTNHANALEVIAGKLQSGPTKEAIIQSIDSLQKELTRLSTELGTTQANLRTANDQIDALNTQLETARAVNDSLNKQITGLEGELAVASSTGEGAASALVAAREELAAKKREIEGLHKQLEDCRGKVAKLELDLAAAKASGDQTAAALEAQLAAAQTEQGRVQTALEKAEREKSDLQAEVATLTADNATKKTRIAELEASLKAKTTEIETATAEISRLSALEGRADITPEALAAIQADKAKAEAAIAVLTADKAKIARDLENLGIKNISDVEELTKVKATLDALVATFNNMSASIKPSAINIKERSDIVYYYFKKIYLIRELGVSIVNHEGNTHYNFPTDDERINNIIKGLYTSVLIFPHVDAGIIYESVVGKTVYKYNIYSMFDTDSIMIFKILMTLSNRHMITATQFDNILKAIYFGLAKNIRYASFFFKSSNPDLANTRISKTPPDISIDAENRYRTEQPDHDPTDKSTPIKDLNDTELNGITIENVTTKLKYYAWPRKTSIVRPAARTPAGTPEATSEVTPAVTPKLAKLARPGVTPAPQSRPGVTPAPQSRPGVTPSSQSRSGVTPASRTPTGPLAARLAGPSAARPAGPSAAQTPTGTLAAQAHPKRILTLQAAGRPIGI